MSDQPQHDFAACARAWQTLRMAHDRVAARLEAALARSCGISISEFDVLFSLRSRPEEDVRLNALSETVSLSQPALSRLIARLEARGLLARCPAVVDRRAVFARLTESGAALTDRAIEVHAQTVHDALTSRLSETEQAALLQALSQIGR